MTNDIDYKAIGKRIRQRRKECNLTQAQLANICNVNDSHISNIENNSTKLSFPLLIQIANALNTTVNHLLVDVIDNNHSIVMEDVADFFKDCSKTEIYFYLDILKQIKKFYGNNHK